MCKQQQARQTLLSIDNIELTSILMQHNRAEVEITPRPNRNAKKLAQIVG
jgi:hypothetical protein